MTAEAIKATQSGMDAFVQGPVAEALNEFFGKAFDGLSGGLLDSVAVPVVGQIVAGWARVLQTAFGPGEKAKAYVVDAPGFSPRDDRAMANRVLDVLLTNDWSKLFMPPGGIQQGPRLRGFGDLDLGDLDVGPWIYGSIDWEKPKRSGGYGLGRIGNWRSQYGTFGFIPGPNVLHWGTIAGEATDAFDVGSLFPSTGTACTEAWRMCTNIGAPQIWQVNASFARAKWLEYMVALRRYLHFTYIPGPGWNTPYNSILVTFNRAKGERDPGLADANMQTRRKICNDLANVLGWAKWGSLDESMVGKSDMPEDEAIERFGLEKSFPIKAMDNLLARQKFAAGLATAAYAESKDPALADPEVREKVEKTQALVVDSPAVKYLDGDMVGGDLGVRVRARISEIRRTQLGAILPPDSAEIRTLPLSQLVVDAPKPGRGIKDLVRSSVPPRDPPVDGGSVPSGSGGGMGLGLLAVGLAGVGVVATTRMGKR